MYLISIAVQLGYRKVCVCEGEREKASVIVAIITRTKMVRGSVSKIR